MKAYSQPIPYFNVYLLKPEEWVGMARDSHLTVFGEESDPAMDRIDGVLFVLSEPEDKPAAYVQFRYHDAESMYWPYGGAFPGLKGSGDSRLALGAVIQECWALGMKRISFLVENDNVKMLKLAMNAGFRIVGVRMYKNKVLLEHGLERS